MVKALLSTILITLALPVAAQGDEHLDYAAVEFVRAQQADDGSWTFFVTVRHNDQGWDHYANVWQVVDLEGEQVLGERILLHPHDTEQPFTRSQRGIVIPQGMSEVIVRAACQVHGFGGTEVVVDLTASEGPGFEVDL